MRAGGLTGSGLSDSILRRVDDCEEGRGDEVKMSTGLELGGEEDGRSENEGFGAEDRDGDVVTTDAGLERC
jgi:hypothetical protein